VRRLPKGEETLPIVEVEGRFLTPQELAREHLRAILALPEIRVSDELLIERVRRRIAQGREPTIYRLGFPMVLTPVEQLRHMEMRDEIGIQLIEAERKLLEEELTILRGG